jgi:hypothetical protein
MYGDYLIFTITGITLNTAEVSLGDKLLVPQIGGGGGGVKKKKIKWGLFKIKKINPGLIC